MLQQLQTSEGLVLNRAELLLVVQISKENGQIQHYGSTEAKVLA